MNNRLRSFQFSQSNLQDFSDCRRRFYLRHIQDLAWPAVDVEPIMESEKWMRQGSAFHLMVHQSILSIPEAMLSEQANSEPLATWWANFLAYRSSLTGLQDKEAIRHPEFTLTAHIGKYSIIAKYDLMSTMPDSSIVIYDWKTSRHRPKRSTLENRLQTLVYPVVVSACCPELLYPLETPPAQIIMVYWFAGFPNQPEVFNFEQPALEESRQKLETMMDTITRLVPQGDEAFPLTTDLQKCTYCIYRSLCDRGVHAGTFDDADLEGEAQEFIIDLEQIGEIEY